MTAPAKGQNRTLVGTGYPAPGRLATPTDLKSHDVQAVVEAINPLVADAFALYIKTKNFHWHVSGPQFRDYHLLLDEQADQLLASTDILAERVRRIGGTTIRSLAHIQKLTRIADDQDDEVSPRDMIRRLLDDNRQMVHALREAIAICEASRDSVTANVMEELLDQTEKRVWFLFETIQSA
jgi:starvation-inducible DNA-binding protein